MGTIKHRNIKGLTVTEEVERNTDQLYQKKKKIGLNGTDNYNGVVTLQEPDSLEYEVKWALG